MGRPKVAVRKKRIEPFPIKVTFSMDQDLETKIKTVCGQFSVNQSQAIRMLLSSAPQPSPPKQLSGEDFADW